MAQVQCLGCNDRGYVVFDGVKRVCANGCAAAQDFQRAQQPRPGLDPLRLPPGGDTLLARDAAEAAGVPPGVIGRDTLVRTTMVVEPLVHELAAALDAVVKGHGGAQERARALLERLPAWAVPTVEDDDEDDDLDAPPVSRSRLGAAPLEPPE